MIPSFKLSNNEIECIKLYNSFEFRVYNHKTKVSEDIQKACVILRKISLETNSAFAQLSEAFGKCSLEYKTFYEAIGKMEIRL